MPRIISSKNQIEGSAVFKLLCWTRMRWTYRLHITTVFNACILRWRSLLSRADKSDEE